MGSSSVLMAYPSPSSCGPGSRAPWPTAETWGASPAAWVACVGHVGCATSEVSACSSTAPSLPPEQRESGCFRSAGLGLLAVGGELRAIPRGMREHGPRRRHEQHERADAVSLDAHGAPPLSVCV